MPLLTLPTELIIEIFSYLPYTSLHLSVAPTCRRFHSIMRTSPHPLSKILYKSYTPTPTNAASTPPVEYHNYIGKVCIKNIVDGYVRLPPDRQLVLAGPGRFSGYVMEWLVPPPEFTVHPCFEKLTLRDRNGEDRFGLDNIGFLQRSGEFIPIINHPASRETAATPGFSYVNISIHRSGYGFRTTSSGTVDNTSQQTPVRVGEVVRGISGELGRDRGALNLGGERLFRAVMEDRDTVRRASKEWGVTLRFIVDVVESRKEGARYWTYSG